MGNLIFVDTNIFLDFYRLRSRDAGLSILGKIEQSKDILIFTEQVEMEFKKNRQNAILDTHKLINPTGLDGLALPPVLAESKASKALQKHKDEIKKQAGAAKKRLEKVLADPSTYDPVFQTMQRIAKFNTSYCLSRTKKERFTIRNLARKRFILGYPPRKASDTSIGDAINWEWIIDCSIASGKGVIIVSRDNDYGAPVGNKRLLNDWLREEFRERVSRRRTIILSDRVADGLMEASIRLTAKEKAAAADLIPASLLVGQLPGIQPVTVSTLASPSVENWQQLLDRFLAQNVYLRTKLADSSSDA